MRPSGSLKLWTGGFINRPGLGPPGYLRFILLLCMASLVYTLFYAVFVTLGNVGNPYDSAIQMVSEALILFVSPFLILYTISTNNPLSKVLLLAHLGVTSTSLVYFEYAFADSVTDPLLIGFVLYMLNTVAWLLFSPRSRVYYALIGNSPVPAELEHLVDEYAVPGPFELWIRRVWAFLEPYTPLVIILMSILFVFAGFRNLSP